MAAGTVLIALGSASLGFAYANRDYVKPPELPAAWTDSAGWTNYGPASLGFSFDTREPGCFGCVDPVPWLAAGLALLAVAVIPYLVAVRRR
jgi:hypothetical protein